MKKCDYRFGKNSFDKVYNNIVNFSKIKSEGRNSHIQNSNDINRRYSQRKDQFFNLFKNYVDDVSVSQYTERGGKLTDLDEESHSVYYHLLLKHNMPKGTPYMKDAFEILNYQP